MEETVNEEPDWVRAQRLRLAAWDMLERWQVSKTSEFYAWFDDEGVVQALVRAAMGTGEFSEEEE